MTVGFSRAAPAGTVVAAPGGKARSEVVLWASPAAVYAGEPPCLPASIAMIPTTTGTETVFGVAGVPSLGLGRPADASPATPGAG
ncbi:hypothetical protein ABZV75_34185 [Streptomyces flaveolus]|uniref:hypothetical protein n=1 Tax=Streptomyces flaveolus TaxID=67297 RepID=UPI0033A09D0F